MNTIKGAYAMRAQSFFIILLSFFIISCSNNKNVNNELFINSVNKESFDSIKTSISERINKNQQLIKPLNYADASVQELASIQSQQSIDLKQFEQDLKKIMEKQYEFSEQVVSHIVSRQAIEDKKSMKPRLSLVLNDIVRWGDDTVVTLLRHDHTVFLRLNDSVDGWRLTHVDTDMNKVTFIHNKTQKTVERRLP